MEREDWSGGVLVAQEASALVDLLCKQNSGVLDRIFALVDPNRMDQLRSLTNNRDLVSATVDYFRTSDHNICRRFLFTVYQYCENIPFYLETTVLSVAEHTAGKLCLHFYFFNFTAGSPLFIITINIKV